MDTHVIDTKDDIQLKVGETLELTIDKKELRGNLTRKKFDKICFIKHSTVKFADEEVEIKDTDDKILVLIKPHTEGEDKEVIFEVVKNRGRLTIGDPIIIRVDVKGKANGKGFLDKGKNWFEERELLKKLKVKIYATGNKAISAEFKKQVIKLNAKLGDEVDIDLEMEEKDKEKKEKLKQHLEENYYLVIGYGSKDKPKESRRSETTYVESEIWKSKSIALDPVLTYLKLIRKKDGQEISDIKLEMIEKISDYELKSQTVAIVDKESRETISLKDGIKEITLKSGREYFVVIQDADEARINNTSIILKNNNKETILKDTSKEYEIYNTDIYEARLYLEKEDDYSLIIKNNEEKSGMIIFIKAILDTEKEEELLGGTRLSIIVYDLANNSSIRDQYEDPILNIKDNEETVLNAKTGDIIELRLETEDQETFNRFKIKIPSANDEKDDFVENPGFDYKFYTYEAKFPGKEGHTINIIRKSDDEVVKVIRIKLNIESVDEDTNPIAEKRKATPQKEEYAEDVMLNNVKLNINYYTVVAQGRGKAIEEIKRNLDLNKIGEEKEINVAIDRYIRIKVEDKVKILGEFYNYYILEIEDFEDVKAHYVYTPEYKGKEVKKAKIIKKLDGKIVKEFDLILNVEEAGSSEPPKPRVPSEEDQILEQATLRLESGTADKLTSHVERILSEIREKDRILINANLDDVVSLKLKIPFETIFKRDYEVVLTAEGNTRNGFIEYPTKKETKYYDLIVTEEGLQVHKFVILRKRDNKTIKTIIVAINVGEKLNSSDSTIQAIDRILGGSRDRSEVKEEVKPILEIGYNGKKIGEIDENNNKTHNIKFNTNTEYSIDLKLKDGQKLENYLIKWKVIKPNGEILKGLEEETTGFNLAPSLSGEYKFEILIYGNNKILLGNLSTAILTGKDISKVQVKIEPILMVWDDKEGELMQELTAQAAIKGYELTPLKLTNPYTLQVRITNDNKTEKYLVEWDVEYEDGHKVEVKDTEYDKWHWQPIKEGTFKIKITATDRETGLSGILETKVLVKKEIEPEPRIDTDKEPVYEEVEDDDIEELEETTPASRSDTNKELEDELLLKIEDGKTHEIKTIKYNHKDERQNILRVDVRRRADIIPVIPDELKKYYKISWRSSGFTKEEEIKPTGDEDYSTLHLVMIEDNEKRVMCIFKKENEERKKIILILNVNPDTEKIKLYRKISTRERITTQRDEITDKTKALKERTKNIVQPIIEVSKILEQNGKETYKKIYRISESYNKSRPIVKGNYLLEAKIKDEDDLKKYNYSWFIEGNNKRTKQIGRRIIVENLPLGNYQIVLVVNNLENRYMGEVGAIFEVKDVIQKVENDDSQGINKENELENLQIEIDYKKDDGSLAKKILNAKDYIVSGKNSEIIKLKANKAYGFTAQLLETTNTGQKISKNIGKKGYKNIWSFSNHLGKKLRQDTPYFSLDSTATNESKAIVELELTKEGVLTKYGILIDFVEELADEITEAYKETTAKTPAPRELTDIEENIPETEEVNQLQDEIGILVQDRKGTRLKTIKYDYENDDLNEIRIKNIRDFISLTPIIPRDLEKYYKVSWATSKFEGKDIIKEIPNKNKPILNLVINEAGDKYVEARFEKKGEEPKSIIIIINGEEILEIKPNEKKGEEVKLSEKNPPDLNSEIKAELFKINKQNKFDKTIPPINLEDENPISLPIGKYAIKFTVSEELKNEEIRYSLVNLNTNGGDETELNAKEIAIITIEEPSKYKLKLEFTNKSFLIKIIEKELEFFSPSITTEENIGTPEISFEIINDTDIESNIKKILIDENSGPILKLPANQTYHISMKDWKKHFEAWQTKKWNAVFYQTELNNEDVKPIVSLLNAAIKEHKAGDKVKLEIVLKNPETNEIINEKAILIEFI